MPAPDNKYEPIGPQVQTLPSIVANKGAVAACESDVVAKRRSGVSDLVNRGSSAANEISKREETLEYWFFCGDGSGMRSP